MAPELAIGDGGLGFWKALHEIWPETRQQRCWVHKTANVLNKLPSSVQGKAKKDLCAIYEAENRESAERAFDRFIAKYGTKHDNSADCLVKDPAALLAIYDFPAEHWKHVRTSNPIESTFATVRLRTDKQRYACHARRPSPPRRLLTASEVGAKASWPLRVFKLAKSAERHWRKPDGADRLGQLIEGVEFRNGEPVQDAGEKATA